LLVQAKNHQQKRRRKMRKNKQIGTRLKVVQSNTSPELKKKEDDQKDWSNFNEACKDFISIELKNLFENSKMETNAKLYTFMFHLTQEFVWDKLPIGAFRRAIDVGVKDGNESYLNFLKDTYDIKIKEEAKDIENRTVN
jgi:hypothetical protein